MLGFVRMQRFRFHYSYVDFDIGTWKVQTDFHVTETVGCHVRTLHIDRTSRNSEVSKRWFRMMPKSNFHCVYQ